MTSITDEPFSVDKLWLQNERAVLPALKLMSGLKRYGNLETDVENPPDISSASHLYGKTGGKMFGVLVCIDAAGNEVILKAFSGKYNDQRSIRGWVPHLFDEDLFNAVIEEGNGLIHPLTEAIRTATDLVIKKQLIADRKANSHLILEKLYALYEVHNFAGEKASLREAVSGNGNIPTGTGDCCAPKLLNFAAVNGLKPVGLAEFYMGKPLKASDKVEGEFYAPCREKCEPILSFMLKGIAFPD